MMRLKQHTFGHFLKKHGMVPPNMMGEEFNEENIIQEELEERKDPFKQILDHKEDNTCFDISIVNKQDMCLNVDCTIHNGEIRFGKVKVFS